MNEWELPKALRQFITVYIQSVEQIEVLLLLYHERGRDWTVDEIDHRVRSSTASITARLNTLVGQKLIVRNDAEKLSFRYLGSDADLDQLVRLLAEHFKVRKNRVIEAIYSSPTQKMLTLRDAFKVTKDSDND